MKPTSKSIVPSGGFTIVELLVVIVVVGALAAVSFIAYSGIRQRAVDTTLQTDLRGASQQAKIAEVTSGNYPADTSGFKASSGTSYQYTVNNVLKTFCITATSGTTSYFIDQVTLPGSGACVGHVAGGANPLLLAWTQRLAGYTNSIAMSSDGTRLIATDGQFLRTSTDSGATWTQRLTAPSYEWADVSSSADGTRLFAIEGIDETAGGGSMWSSSNSGVTWVQRFGIGYPPSPGAVASSSDGMRLAVTTTALYSVDNPIFTSTDAGATWVQRSAAGLRSWGSIASSADGTRLVAAPGFGFIFTSSNSGLTWTQRATTRFWTGLASSADGTRLIASTFAGAGDSLYRSTDSGVTWSPITAAGTSINWYGATISDDGTRMAAVKSDFTNGVVVTSIDSGATWTEQTGAGRRNWQVINIIATPDGSTIALSTGFNGNIYIGKY